MADQIIYQQHRVTDDDGLPVAGAKVNVYATGTLTRIDTFSDSAATMIQTNPIIADASGYFGQMFTADSGVRLVVTDAANVTLYDIDPAPVTLATNAGAGSISFTPTVNIPYSTVQAAIEGLDTDQRAILQGVGWNLTTTSTILANLDAINLASGAYRFGNTTTGTYPAGVTATDKGVVFFMRGPTGSGVMTIWLEAQYLSYTRRMVGDVWSGWWENPLIDGPWAVGDIAYRQVGSWKTRPIGAAGAVLVVNDAVNAPAWAAGSLTGQTITSGALYTLTHGFGRKPRSVTFELVCVTAEHGYSIGDVVEVLPLQGTAVRKSTTAVAVRLSSTATAFVGGNHATGAAVSFTNANWTMNITTF